MLVSVGERTGEIGLLKAIGGTRRQVLFLFLTEAVLISAAGGISGLVLGSSILGAASLRWPAISSLPPAWAALAALGVAMGVGALFGLLPALRAMKLEPVVALTRRSA
jgi:putative ABC transport system permease protein